MTDNTQARLLRWAVFFLFIHSITLTLSPAVRERSWDVDYKFAHWFAFIVWLICIYVSNIETTKYLQDHDPFLYPAVAFLSGWGLLTIWRLDELFGFKQTIWLSISTLVFIIILRLQHQLPLLRRYKYILLASGLLLTSLTIIFGTNPMGIGPHLWLGCCGIYFQPSEPLKLLLVIYLAAYLADRPFVKLNSVPLLIPTVLLTGLALLLLFIQRDLGTASIFIFIYTIILFVATGKKRILVAAVFAFGAAVLVGYFYIDIVATRINVWLNPWEDPSGQSYQIIQSILAVASGGFLGRGPGMGNPLLVPVAISDFIFAAIAEETGLIGTLGLLATIWLILSRGTITALHASDRFRRFLAMGIVAYLGIQSLLIIGGNTRVLPLTGVTLPFVSYGGSSLLTSYIAVAILIIISVSEENEPAALSNYKPYSILTTILGLGLFICALSVGWWTLIRGSDLLSRTDNARRAIADRYVPRGSLLDRNNKVFTLTAGQSGSYERVYLYPELAPILGYTHPIFGQAGLEGTLDDYLRGLQGNPSSLIWWDHLLYGTPPPGLDVRLSIDMGLQTRADQLLGGHTGALILMNAKTGEILAMASHPTFDPNKLDQEGDELATNKGAPLLNRATQGLYPIGTSLLPLIRTQFTGAAQPDDSQLKSLYTRLMLYQNPALNIPTAQADPGISPQDLRISPLQALLAASTLSNHGVIPAPRISMAVNTPEQGWVVLPAQGQAHEVIQAEAADEAAMSFIVQGKPYWSHTGQASTNETVITWLIAGTLPNWGGTPLVLIVTLEEDNTFLAEHIRQELLDDVVK
jgi:cell division protein FtsW (lipid II flippase)